MPTSPRSAALLTAVLLAISAAPDSVAQAPAATPEAVVRAFYAYHFAHDMAFTAAAVRRRARWLTADLLALCRAYFARPSPADEVPAIDGDPFTDSQDTPDAYQVGAATVAGDTSLIPVALSWKAGDRRTIVAVLVKVRGAWRMTDLRYADEPSLRQQLAAAP